ncbi:DUF1269 domain-containing protein [Pseudoduganella danionis]|uniref:DUF1269 domain-containing protein n=1 Tax=Pseudoduganella danionis TaxID=1890295 RepID=UPI0035ADC0E1
MQRRLYFTLPDAGSARAVLDELLLARISIRHIHFLARQAMAAELPTLGLLARTDIVHGAQLGAAIGAAIGLACAIALAFYPIAGWTAGTFTILLLMLGGALLGSWASAMNAAAVPNTRLRRFAAALAQGRVLLILDLPAARVDDIEAMLAKRHPAASFGGMEPPALAFP